MASKWKQRGLVGVAAMALGLVVATSAWAQNFFYREEVKDGRIYVFAIAKEFEAWAKSGEMGKALSRPGYGPNGETVVFDSEDAMGLFNLKNNRPGDPTAIAPPVKKPKMEVSWKDGKTTIATDKAQLNLSNRIQARWTQLMPDETVQLPGTESKGDSVGSFRIRRAKMKLDGWIYKKEFQYEFQLNFADTASTLEDANINWDVSKKKAFMVKFGQFKVPFGRQELTSSGSQQFVDRSQVSNEYAKGRDAGLQLWGLLAGEKIDWRVGVFNGNQRNKAANDNDEYQFNARLQFQPNGDPKYSESDLDTKDGKLLWALAANFEQNDLRRTTTSIDTKRRIFGFDGVLKYNGFSATGEYFIREITPEPAAAGAPVVEFNSDGWYGQIGYAFGAKRSWEIAGRYGSYDPSDRVDIDDRKEWRVGLNYFYNKHNFKVQADYGQLETEAAAGSIKNDEFRLQTQFIF